MTKPTKEGQSAKPFGHSVGVFNPNPDMGQANQACTTCNHGQAKHYGESRNWCNVEGCQCQEYAAPEKE